MRIRLSRVVAVLGIALAVLGVTGTPGGALALATLETQAEVPTAKGVVSYRGGASDNTITLHRAADSGLTFTDPAVVIVAYRVGVTQNCTGGVGAASCGFGVYTGVQGQEGDDTITVTDDYGFPFSLGVNCGPGDDTAIVPTGTSVDPSCETVQVV